MINIIFIKSVTLRKMRKMGLENNRDSFNKIGIILDHKLDGGFIGILLLTMETEWGIEDYYIMFPKYIISEFIFSQHTWSQVFTCIGKILRADTLKLKILKNISIYSQKPEKIEEHEFLITQSKWWCVFYPQDCQEDIQLV